MSSIDLNNTPNNTGAGSSSSGSIDLRASNPVDLGVEKPQTILDKLTGYTQALGLGAMQGGNDYKSTFDKAASFVQNKTGIDPRLMTEPGKTAMNYMYGIHDTPQQVQGQYLNDLQQYQNNPAVQQHPLMANIGRVAGNLAIQAPALAEGMGQGPSTLGNGSEYALANTLAGGLHNQPTQGTSVFNPTNAAIAGALTIPLFAGQTLANSYMTNIGKESLNKVTQALSASKDTESALTQGLMNHIDPITGDINVQSLDSYAQKVLQSSTSMIDQKSAEALHGLTTMLPWIKGGAGASVGGTVGYMMDGKEGAMKGAAIGGGITGAILAAPSVLGTIWDSSPLSKSLLFLNNLGEKATDNPNLITYGVSKALDQMTSAGIQMNLNNNGSVQLEKQNKQNKNNNNNIKTSLFQNPTSGQSSSGQQVALGSNEQEPAIPGWWGHYNKTNPNTQQAPGPQQISNNFSGPLFG